MECCVRRCDIICAAKVRICVECVGGSDECSRMDKTGGRIWCGYKKSALVKVTHGPG
jgi:hypothetical protein